MPLSSRRTIGESMKTVQISVDDYTDKKLSGTIYHDSLKGSLRFTNLMQMLIALEDLQDEMDYPKASTEKRRFLWPIQGEQTDELTKDERRAGKLATFFVRMIFRQNSTWQGTVIWSEGGVDEIFRSALELIMLMDSALNNE